MWLKKIWRKQPINPDHRSFIRMAYQSHCQHMQNWQLGELVSVFPRMKWLTVTYHPQPRDAPTIHELLNLFLHPRTVKSQKLVVY